MGTPEVVRLRLTPAKAWSLVIALLAAVVAVGLPPMVGSAHAANGNNGTVMINGIDLSSKGNDPHISCPVVTQFSGFDVGGGVHSVSVDMISQSPTGPLPSGTVINYVPAAQNFSGTHDTQTFTPDFSAFTPNNKGEYHVNITVTVADSLGSLTKSKTFWVMGCGSLQLSSACDQTAGANNGDILWTVTNPNAFAISGMTISATGGNPVATWAGGTNSVPANSSTTFTTGFFTGTMTVSGTGNGQQLTSNVAASPQSCSLPAPSDMTLTSACQKDAGNQNTGLVLWSLGNPNAVAVTSLTVSSSGAPVTASNWNPGQSVAAGGTTTFTTGVLAGGDTITVYGDANGQTAHSNAAGSPAACAPPLSDLTLSGVCQKDAGNQNTGLVLWTVNNPNAVAVTSLTVTPSSGNVTASNWNPAQSVVANGSTTFTTGVLANAQTIVVSGSANNTTVNSNSAAGPASCPLPVRAPQQLTVSSACETSNGANTGLVLWTVANPNSTAVTSASYVTSLSPNATGVSDIPANGQQTFKTSPFAGTLTVSGTTNGQPVSSNAGAAQSSCPPPLQPPAPVVTPNLGLAKAVDAGNNAIVQPGQQLTYALTYTNSGNGAASGVSVTDVLPANATFVSVADGGSYDAGTKTATWTIGNVAPGGTGTVHWTVAVGQNLPAGSAVTNVAMIGSTPSNTVTNPVAVGDLTLGKAVDKDTAEFGDTLTYTLTAAATGVLNQTGVVVSDTLPAGTTYVDGSASCASPCTASYDAANRQVVFNVGNLAAGAQLPVSFQVTVDRPTPAADGSIPAVLITNVGQVLATGLVDPVMSNEVNTAITAVLGVKITRPTVKPPVVQPKPVVQPSTLPFTGASFPVMLFVQVGAGLAVVGVLMLLLSRRRDSGRHLA